MAKKKIDTFILRNDFFPQIKMLSREQRGDLLTAIFAYSTGEELPDMDMVTQMCFGFIKSSLDSNSEKYQAKCDKNRENGARGGRPSSKPNGSENNRTVSDESERFSEEPNGNTKVDEKPNAKNGNPIKYYSDSYSNLKSDSKSNSISVSELRGEEREIFLKILLFDKKLLNPFPELERFVAYYEKTGWVDANGNAIKNRAAALKFWKPDENAEKCPAGIADTWREVYNAVTGAAGGEDCTLMLSLFRGLYAEGDTIHVTVADKSLMAFMEEPKRLLLIREVLDRRFGPGKKLHYRIPK
ncbi:DUF6291 domain-containing protein [Alistipes finegoldii]|jgi:hypothetical protein|uniref:DUF6291 domain-containing protein n=1 Tax=Alistipes finegoldii TaxID=214856 RepID=UPI003AB6FEDE